MRDTTPPNLTSPGILLSTHLIWSDQSHPLNAFVDSGAAGNFMDLEIARHLQVPLTHLDEPLTITALDGGPLGTGRVSLSTIPVYLRVGGHQESIQFYVIKSPEFPLILGFPWLALHNPQIDWSSGNIVKWGKKTAIVCVTLLHPLNLLFLSSLVGSPPSG